jgi:hypothetical protein
LPRVLQPKWWKATGNSRSGICRRVRRETLVSHGKAGWKSRAAVKDDRNRCAETDKSI